MTVASRTYLRRVFLVGVTMLLAASLGAAQTTLWRGLSSGTWRSVSEWSNGIPDYLTRTTVSVGSPSRYDVVVPAPSGGDTASVCELTIQSGGRVTFAPLPDNGVLVVHGSALSLNNGELQLGDGRIVFRSSVQINNGGQIDAGSGIMEFQGNISANSGAAFLPGTSTAVFSGSGDQTVSGDLHFHDLIVETSGTLTLSGSITVTGDIVINAGSTVVVASGSDFEISGSISGGGTFVNENTLPVQMNALTAQSTGTGVVLQWSTASELNNFGFVMERREILDPGFRNSDFVRIGFVPGSGTSTSRLEYTYVDQRVLPGRYAYRITSIDRDGTSHQSLEVEAAVAVPDGPGLDGNYPNPFNPETKIGYRMKEKGWVKVAVYDLLGREIAVLVDGVRPAGAHTVSWDATGFPSGVYYSRMEYSDQSSARPLILSR